MPSQYSQLLQAILLLLLLAATTHTILAADVEKTPAGCPGDEKCGNISIPFPFGIKPGCFREGLEVICNYSFNPPRAFLSEGYRMIMDENYTSYEGILPRPNSSVYTGLNQTHRYEPIELVDISASKSELRVYGGLTSDCVNPGTEFDHQHQTHTMRFGPPFLVSPLRNVLVGVGSKAQAGLSLNVRYPLFDCLSSINVGLQTSGSCTGRGCCQASFPPPEASVPPVNGFIVTLLYESGSRYFEFQTAPCSYAMVVETSWYNFSSEDMLGHLVLPNKYPRGVPIVLDFDIGNGGSCPAEGQQPSQDYACISGNSYCVNRTSYGRAFRRDGYVCRCWDNYDGNPYIKNGCQDINECADRHLNNCSSGAVCKNTLGGYECPCKTGMRGDGKEGTCKEIFPLPAKVSVGVASFIVVIVLMVLVHQLHKLKKFYEQNGGPVLEGVRNIRIYTSKQLKKMTNNYKVVIGEGHFGKVYMGTLKGKQDVAIKKTIKVDECSKKDFIDEVVIQSGMRHKNIVRLLGCCLEMDVPMLMYEYVVKGSLYDVLFKSKDIIPVDTRLRIAIGSAEGLAYMHSAVESTIRHGDVKSGNILLDESFTPKISDFGTSKLLARGKSEKTEWVTGDMAYIDPAYMDHGILTQKSDVYSFGIVLIELITRRAAKYDENMSYTTNFIQACQAQNARNFVDNNITSENDIELIEMVSEVALECLKPNPDERLDMRQVVNRLNIIGQFEQHG